MAFEKPIVTLSVAIELWSSGVWMAFVMEEAMYESLAIVIELNIVTTLIVMISKLMDLLERVADSDRVRSWVRHRTSSGGTRRRGLTRRKRNTLQNIMQYTLYYNLLSYTIIYYTILLYTVYYILY